MSSQFRILPILIIVAMLAFAVRLAEVYTGISHLSGIAFAEESPKKPSEPPEAEKKAEEEVVAKEEKKSDEDSKGDNSKIEKAEAEKSEDLGSPPEWRDASDSDTDVGSIKMELLKEVSEKSKKLDELEKSLNVREALLKAASQELERKYQELEKLKKEIEGLLEQQGEEENQRITSLVKIYEGMKPVDAARIFDTLDLDVLVSVLSRMSERKISPILAAMSAERAKTVTIMLAEQKKLPELPQ